MDPNETITGIAAGYLADPADAAAFLDQAKYTAEDGTVDTTAVEADLAALVTRKPYLAKAPATDFRTCSRHEYELEAAKYGITPRSYINPYFRR